MLPHAVTTFQALKSQVSYYMTLITEVVFRLHRTHICQINEIKKELILVLNAGFGNSST